MSIEEALYFAAGAVIAALVLVVRQHVWLQRSEAKRRMLRRIIKRIAEGKYRAVIGADNNIIIEEKI